MSASTVRFPVAMIHYSAPPVPGGAARVVAEHAKALARAGYPVRRIAGQGSDPSPDIVVRHVPLLWPAHPRIQAITESLARGEVPEGYEECVLDLAQAIGRELVGCGTTVVHDCLTMPSNLPAAEAMWRLEKGSRGPKVPGAPERRWVVWAHDCAAASGRFKEFDRKERPWSLLRERLPGAAYVAASEARRKLVAKALKIAQKDVVTVPDGVDVREFLELTPNVRELDRELGLVEADAVLLTPTRLVEHKGLHRGLEIVRA
ncbi:MAG: glycosyltransferase family protein, partial [Planctomycetota bacterium]